MLYRYGGVTEMVQIDIKPALLELFQDEEIKLQILNIVEDKLDKENGGKRDDKYNKLILEIGKLKTENENIKKECQEKEKQLGNTLAKIEEYEKEIQQYILYKKQIDRRLQPVDAMLDLWERIQCIPERHKRYFNELAGAESMIAYFSVGRDMAKIKQMQQYIQGIAVEDTEDEEIYKTLNDLLCFCVDVGNYSKSPSEQLNKIYICAEEEFDVNKCIKTSSSKNTGYISQILVQGFDNQEGKVVFKNIVRLS